jgi:NAD(P)-dependent dehydrogenase (short-subunit alcohol dehydrogenase family)
MQDSPFTRYRSLEERVVLVTGGGSGIGATLVEAFLEQGSRVHFIDFDQGAGQNVATDVGGTFHHCDLRDINALRLVISQIEEMDGAIDVLVNNAGNDDRHDMFAVEPDYWRDRLAVNLDHQFFAAQAVSTGMKRRGQGCILFTSSTSFMKGRPGMVAYTTSKAAIIGLNKTLARELGANGVRVNCIIPGAISTSRQDALWRTSEGEAEIMKMQAIKIRLVARDVAAMALFLASDDARGCTGAQFLVDAGIT